MSFRSPEDFAAHCHFILQSRRIRNKIVILCEGDPLPPDTDRPSPQTYSRMEQMPDANFYKACVPRWWSQRRPEFFNCGDRTHVINTYFELLQLHQANPSNSYLNPTKLLAIVDLDIGSAKLDSSYPFPDTEAIFRDLYHQGEVNLPQSPNHTIWVTGLIHKEAYFIAPHVETVLKQHPTTPHYKGQPIILRDFYLDMADAAQHEPDLVQNFPQVAHRAAHAPTLDCTDLNCFLETWKKSFQTATTPAERHQITTILLTLKKSKDFWHQITPPKDWTSPEETYREQLSLAIAREFYAQEPKTSNHHLPAFFNTIHTRL
jgi:hypothetical protein